MQSLRVLIIEDEMLIAVDLRQNLEDAGDTAVGIPGSLKKA
ncbi:hypothetical protein ACLNGM_21825 [Aureimonas phyllosphaerae]